MFRFIAIAGGVGWGSDYLEHSEWEEGVLLAGDDGGECGVVEAYRPGDGVSAGAGGVFGEGEEEGGGVFCAGVYVRVLGDGEVCFYGGAGEGDGECGGDGVEDFVMALATDEHELTWMECLL